MKACRMRLPSAVRRFGMGAVQRISPLKKFFMEEARGMLIHAFAGEVIDEIVFDVVVSTVEGLPRARRRDADATAESVRRAVRAVINEHWGKKPICLVHVLTV